MRTETPPGLELPCLCGRPLPAKSCCYRSGRWSPPPPSLLPPLPRTGVINDRCLARATADCSQKLSREHYLSKGVLATIGSHPFVIPGPDGKDEPRRWSLDSLASKLLCKRHNEALSPLDAAAASFFKHLMAAMADELPPTPSWSLVSGDALELWMLKLLCSRLDLDEGDDAHELVLPKLAHLLFGYPELKAEPATNPLYPRLYIRSDQERIANFPSVAIRLLQGERAPDQDWVVYGVECSLSGCHFQFWLVPPPPSPKLLCRPTYIQLLNPKAIHSIFFGWDENPGHRKGYRLDLIRSENAA